MSRTEVDWDGILAALDAMSHEEVAAALADESVEDEPTVIEPARRAMGWEALPPAPPEAWSVAYGFLRDEPEALMAMAHGGGR